MAIPVVEFSWEWWYEIRKVFDCELANAVQGITLSLSSANECDICPFLSILRHVMSYYIMLCHITSCLTRIDMTVSNCIIMVKDRLKHVQKVKKKIINGKKSRNRRGKRRKEFTGLLRQVETCQVLYDMNWQLVSDKFGLVYFCLTRIDRIFKTSLDLSSFVRRELSRLFRTSLDLSSICLMHFTMMWNRYVIWHKFTGLFKTSLDLSSSVRRELTGSFKTSSNLSIVLVE